MGITGSAQFGFDRRRMSLAIRKLNEHPGLFSEAFVTEAESLLQIGSRQVKALHDWIRWAGLAQREGSSTYLTPLGELLLDVDETLEDPLSWYVIHHRLAGDRSAATAYWLAFRKTSAFIGREVMLSVMRREEPGRKDRTYEDAYRNLNQILANPEMSDTAGILSPTDSGYERVEDPPVTAGLASWLILDWCQSRDSVSMTLSELRGEEGPARPFRLSEDHLADLMHEARDSGFAPWLTVSRTAGLDSVALIRPPDPGGVLREAYLNR